MAWTEIGWSALAEVYADRGGEEVEEGAAGDHAEHGDFC
eukprot:CAMPEP_0182913916 /NCGR_PEP_ID=MMETSP0034_2-20130328/38281_1 /TAXON_ID=156128 /ORGANISM="Nephroselmis pyriformis, Strain CCMP717" /LENGTH=38 /DNA_ID= /DNA_START= /DNA_END= /DNA_ORIENTATION=